MIPEIFRRINPFSRTLNDPQGVQVSVRVDIQRELNWNLIHSVLYKVAIHGSPWRRIRLSLLLDKPCNVCFFYPGSVKWLILICPAGLLSPSPYTTTKNLFPPRWTKSFFLPLTACSLYLSEEKIKQSRQGNENNFSPPVDCQSTAGQAIIFPPKINACVLCVRVLRLQIMPSASGDENGFKQCERQRKILAVSNITTTVAPHTRWWQHRKKTNCLLHFRVLNLNNFSMNSAMMWSQEQTMINSR